MAGPGWQGTKPDGIKKVLRSESQFVYCIIRTEARGPDDLGAVLGRAGFCGPVHVEFREDERDGALRPIEIKQWSTSDWGGGGPAVHLGVGTGSHGGGGAGFGLSF